MQLRFWGSSCDVHITKILTLQKRAVRVMTFKDQFPAVPGPLHPSNPLFLKLELIKIKYIFILQILKFIHKCINSNIIGNFAQWFKLKTEVHTHLTKTNYNTSSQVSTNKLSIPFGRTTHYGLKQIKVKGPKIWNSLPLDLRNIKSLINFKISIKKHLLGTYT